MTTDSQWRLMQTLFIVSGAAALAYEIVWGRWLVTVLGGSTIATCVVLSCYMGGLAAGAWAFGRLSSTAPAPLRIYVWVEISIGFVAILFPAFASWVLGLPGAVRLAASVVMLLVPTFLMGGTLPLVIAWTQKAGLPEGRSLGRLYGLNTVGAAGGCLAAGFWGIPALGLSRTNALAAVLNILIAVVVFFAFRRGWRAEKDAAPVAAQGTGSPAEPAAESARWPMHTVAFISGLATLGIEVLWIRLLRITLGSTTYTFTLVVATFILGLGIGGLWAGRVPESARPEVRLARSQLLLVALLALQFLALPLTPVVFSTLRFGATRWNSALLGSALLCLALLLPVTLVIGYLFPLLGRLYMRGGQRGRDVGQLYTVNTVGAVTGAVLTTLALVPWLGTAGAMLLLVALTVVSLGIYLHLARRQVGRLVMAAALAVGLTVVGLMVTRPGWTPDYLGYGAGWTQKLKESKNLYFAEGRSSTVLVESYDLGRVIRIDGKPVASTLLEDKANQVLLGHLPALLTSEVRNGLVVGLGSGMTLGALALHGLEELHLVELEPKVVEATRFFADDNHGVMDREELRVHFDDGFNFLHTTGLRFDVITSDPIQPFFRGAATLYSVEYFRRAAERLSERGVMAHWLPLANMSPEDFKMITRSFTDVFPYARLYWTGSTTDAILIGRNVPWDEPGIDAAQYRRAAASLQSIAIDSAEEMASLLMAERPVMRSWAGERGVRNTVEMPILEFTAGQALFAYTTPELLENLLAMRRHSSSGEPVWQATTILLAHKARSTPNGHAEVVLKSLLAAAGCDPDRPDCELIGRSGLLRRLIWNRAIREADRYLTRAFAAENLKKAWWHPAESAPVDALAAADLDRGVDYYEVMTRLTSDAVPGDRALVDKRLARLLTLLPEDSPYGDRLRSLQAL